MSKQHDIEDEIEIELHEDFVIELFSVALKNKEILEIVLANVKDGYLPDDDQKKLLKELKAQYQIENKKPTYGTLKNAFRKERNMLEYITSIQEVDVENPEVIVKSLSEFIKQSIFVESYDQIGEIWNRGGDGAKHKSFELFKKASEQLANFSLNADMFEKVFGDFNKRQGERLVKSFNRADRVPTGIYELDKKINGGFELGDFILFLGDAKSGKSFLLTHLGIAAARRGFPVMHIQLEDKKEKCLNRYDAAWSGTNYFDMKNGTVSDAKYKAHKKIVENLGKSEIYVHASERFKSVNMIEIRQQLIELKKTVDIKVVIIDYMDLADPDEKFYAPGDERFRQIKVTQMCKDLALEQNCLVYSATQSSSVDPELLNDPDFVLTRYNLNEGKGKVRSCDGLITINGTKEERKSKVCRLYTDALREHEAGFTIHIKQNLSHSRFYNHKATMDEFEEEMSD